MLVHPHVTKLYDHFESDSEIYLVFEYVPKGELFEIVSNENKVKGNYQS